MFAFLYEFLLTPVFMLLFFKELKNDLSSYSRVSRSRTHDGRNAKSSPKRRVQHEEQSTHLKKKARLDESDGWGCRPKRATQQLRNTVYKEKIENTPNPIGRDVLEYAKNGKFNPKTLTVEEDKKYCIGQIIAKELIGLKGHKWAVKYCEVEELQKSEFVTFKDCNNSNTQMREALRGTSDTSEARAFIGYSELAQFVLENGLIEILIKDTAEVKKMLKSLDIPWKSAKGMTGSNAAPSETAQRQPSPDQSTKPSSSGNAGTDCANTSSETMTRNSTSRFVEQMTGEEKKTSLGMASIDFEQVKQLRCLIREKLNNIKEGNTYGSDSWKITHATSFYSSLMAHLAKQLNDQSLNVTDFHDFMNSFEEAMKELYEEENLGDSIGAEVTKSYIRYMIKKVDVASCAK